MNEIPISVDTTSHNLTQVAELRLKSVAFWAEVNWNLHNWFVALSLVGSLIVPFGIAALPYIDKSQERSLNLVLILISAASLVLQLMSIQLRLPQRAARGRRDRDKLTIAIANHKDGKLSREDFQKILTEVHESAAAEESA